MWQSQRCKPLYGVVTQLSVAAGFPDHVCCKSASIMQCDHLCSFGCHQLDQDQPFQSRVQRTLMKMASHNRDQVFCSCRGLDQKTAVPRDSHLQSYYSDIADKLRVGPPLMFVVEDLNMSRQAPDVDALCSVAGCQDQSFLNQVRHVAVCMFILAASMDIGFARSCSDNETCPFLIRWELEYGTLRQKLMHCLASATCGSMLEYAWLCKL